MHTPRLTIRSIEQKDFPYIAQLFGDKQAMEKMGMGNTFSPSKVQEFFISYENARKNNDPYTRFATFTNSKEFLGIVALTTDDTPTGVAEISYVTLPKFWEQGFGQEAVKMIIHQYALATINQGYKIKGETLHQIVATARDDNPASWHILEKLGMQFKGEQEKFGRIRKDYELNIENFKAACSMTPKS